MNHSAQYLAEASHIALKLDALAIERMAHDLAELRERGGRLFLAGLGGSAANCSHAASDFRNLAGIDAMALSDNVSELTARANDQGFETAYADMLWAASGRDALFILSVGGGTERVSLPIVVALSEAKRKGMRILGIVGRDGGATKALGDHVIVVPTVEACRVTPHTEAFQMVILHCLVSHPTLQQRPTKW